jgi:hypothetical protein
MELNWRLAFSPGAEGARGPMPSLPQPDFNTIVEALRCSRPGCRCRREPANGQVLVHCPAHPDDWPSLSLSVTPDGRLLWRCHAGCSQEAVQEALRRRGLWPAGGSQPAHKETPDPAGWWAERTGVPWNFWAGLGVQVYREADRAGIAFTWPSLPDVVKIRWAGPKSFAWRPEDGPRPWLWPEPEDKLPPEVWLVEGEAEAGILCYAGIQAFTTTKGAEAAVPVEALRRLKAAGVSRVCVLFDADDAGRKGAERNAQAAREAGLEVVVVDPVAAGCRPELGLKDIRDVWFILGRDPEQLRDALENAARRAEARPPGSGGPAPSLRALTPAQILAEAPTAALESLPVLGREGLIIRSWSHVLAGPPKAGKTELLLACAREWTAAGLLVHWLSEEGLGVWAERFRRAGAPDGLLVTPALGADPEELLKHAVAVGADVIVVDTIRTLWRVDELDNPVIAGMFARWNAALLGKTLIYVHHERKGGGQHGEGVAGGFAFVGSVDRVIEVLYDPNQENRRRLRFLSRIESPPELVYELGADGCLVIRGEPTALARAEVKETLAALADDVWRTLAEFLALLPEPRPSADQVRRALNELTDDGILERDPPPGAKGNKAHRWRRAPGREDVSFRLD